MRKSSELFSLIVLIRAHVLRGPYAYADCIEKQVGLIEIKRKSQGI